MDALLKEMRDLLGEGYDGGDKPGPGLVKQVRALGVEGQRATDDVVGLLQGLAPKVAVLKQVLARTEKVWTHEPVKNWREQVEEYEEALGDLLKLAGRLNQGLFTGMEEAE